MHMINVCVSFVVIVYITVSSRICNIMFFRKLISFEHAITALFFSGIVCNNFASIAVCTSFCCDVFIFVVCFIASTIWIFNVVFHNQLWYNEVTIRSNICYCYRIFFYINMLCLTSCCHLSKLYSRTCINFNVVSDSSVTFSSVVISVIIFIITIHLVLRDITTYFFGWTLIISYMWIFSYPLIKCFIIIYSKCYFLLYKLSINTIIPSKIVISIPKAGCIIIALTIISMIFGITFLSVIYSLMMGKDIYGFIGFRHETVLIIRPSVVESVLIDFRLRFDFFLVCGTGSSSSFRLGDDLMGTKLCIIDKNIFLIV